MKERGTSELTRLANLIGEFVSERDWGEFNTPKNLATALCVEAAELLEPFQWLKTGELDELSDKRALQVRHELADVLIYLLALADRLKVDLAKAVEEKLEINRCKYPIELVRGSARKYNEYD